MKAGWRKAAGVALAAGWAWIIVSDFAPWARAGDPPVAPQMCLTGFSREADGALRIHVELPLGFANRIDLYAAPLAGSKFLWRRVAEGLNPSQAASWPLPPHSGTAMAYAFGDASTDTDLDGLSDAFEFFVSRTDPATPDPFDSDADGLPDWWEVLFGLDPQHPSDAALDPDGDGLSSLDEHLLGTHPLRPGEMAGAGTELLHWYTVSAGQ